LPGEHVFELSKFLVAPVISALCDVVGRDGKLLGRFVT
jgi:hypothetical protein